ncbi:MBL fold metallo-hydrolase [Sporomusa sphaeroides]|uniref:MBL fold metallo-hydrolase n=1 Tax=Sporomusa sphaeroides TaxID=47679 RepID=UPI002C517279|nr:MBL fold metallo-hydrolase [Sporomusa sphaeroides]HML31830.1 MBL fold metallo-hydrolase [Sporomusa sphaeroides]
MNIAIRCLSNAGLVFKSPQTTLLVDGLFGGREAPDPFNESWPWESMSDTLQHNIITGGTGFDPIDCLLFTHCHTDHYNSGFVGECIRQNKVKHLVLPNDNERGNFSVTLPLCQNYETNVTLMATPLGVKQTISINDMKISYFKTVHLSSRYTNVPHYSFIISVGEKNFYIAGDTDYSAEYHKAILDNLKIDVGFFNILHFNKKAGREFINTINPCKTVMYHLPFLEGNSGYHEIANKTIKRYGSTLPACTILTHELEQIEC